MKRSEAWHNDERGVSVLEFAIAAPLFLAILIGGLEFSRSLHYLQLAASLSREAASIVYRECLVDAPEKATHCLEEERAKLQAQADGMLEGISIIVSTYRFDPASGDFTRLGQAAGDKVSRFNASGGSLIGDIDPDAVMQQRYFAIGEAFVPFDPVIRGIPGILELNLTEFYDATVM